MDDARLSLKRSFVGIGAEIAVLAGVEWTETLTLRAGTIHPPELDQPDPFFDSLGSWDAERREVVVDVERCERKKPVRSTEALIEIVAVHFCAKAVVQLGIHQRTRKLYVGWDAAEKRFAVEPHPLTPHSRFYDTLVREQELFTQIFTYLHLLDRNEVDELGAFHRLSEGHFGLYALDYSGSPCAGLIDSLLVRDWRREADANRSETAAAARQVFGWLTREVPVDRTDLTYHDE